MEGKKELRQKLSNELRSMYKSVMEEPLPDSMMEFLNHLEEQPDDVADKPVKDRDDSGS